jgi:hypothetical protein
VFFMSALILAGLLLASSQAKPSTQAEVADICSLQNFSQVAFGNCLEAYVEESAARLAKAEKDAAARIANWDEDVRYRAKARSALATSNAEFVRANAASRLRWLEGRSGQHTSIGGLLACMSSMSAEPRRLAASSPASRNAVPDHTIDHFLDYAAAGRSRWYSASPSAC